MSPTFEVGSRVLVAGEDGAHDEDEIGVIVDDYRDVLTTPTATSRVESTALGRGWALTKRFAVALDNGRLVFRDADELRPVPPDTAA